MEETVTQIDWPTLFAAGVAALTGLALAIAKGLEIRRGKNGNGGFTKNEAIEMEARLTVKMDDIGQRLDDHKKSQKEAWKTNAEQHADLHDRVTTTATDVARIEGKLSK